MDRNFTLVIAAAGNGSRMNSPIPKGLVEIDNLTLIEISTSNLLSAACEVVVVIQESQEHFFRTKLPQTFLSRIKFVYQDGLNGTLGALCCALPHCNINNDIILMWADHIGLYNLNFSDLVKISKNLNYDILVPIVVRDNPYVHLELDKNLHITKFNETKNGSFSISKGNNDIGIFLIKSLEARKSISDLYDRLKNDISNREINFLSIFEKLTNLQIIASVLSDESLTLGANSTHELTKNWNEILSSHRIIK